LDEITTNKFLDFALSLADSVRLVTSENHRLWSPTLAEYKDDDSPVTELDRQIELMIRSRVAESYPEHGVLGEEFDETLPDAEFTWVIDPIDGTSEFAAGLPTWGSIIALYQRDEAVLGIIDHPDLDLRLVGTLGGGVTMNSKPLPHFSERPRSKRYICSAPWNFFRMGDDYEVFNKYCQEFSNVRVFHSCFTYTNVFGGMADLMLDWKVKPWDRSCSGLFAKELGATFWQPTLETKGFRTPDFSYGFGRKEDVSRLVTLFD